MSLLEVGINSEGEKEYLGTDKEWKECEDCGGTGKIMSDYGDGDVRETKCECQLGFIDEDNQRKHEDA